MKVRIHDQREFVAGLIFMVIGVGWGCASLFYPIGEATNMGSGYFPLAVSILLVFLGLCSVIRAIRTVDDETLAPWAIAPLLFVFAGIGLFAALIERAGLVLSTIALVVVVSYKRTWSRPVEVAVLAMATAAFVVGLFIYVLQLDLNVLW